MGTDRIGKWIRQSVGGLERVRVAIRAVFRSWLNRKRGPSPTLVFVRDVPRSIRRATTIAGDNANIDAHTSVIYAVALHKSGRRCPCPIAAAAAAAAVPPRKYPDYAARRMEDYIYCLLQTPYTIILFRCQQFREDSNLYPSRTCASNEILRMARTRFMNF